MARKAVLVVLVLVANVSPPARAVPACSWPMYGRDAGHSFDAGTCSEIAPLNVGSLHPAWFYPTRDSVTASPAVVDGVVYVGSWDGTFYALDAEPAPGPVEPRWTFEIDDSNDVAFGRIVSSAAVYYVAGTRVVVFAGGATLYVLDAATGTELASLCVDPRAIGAARCGGSSADIEIESSPVVVEVAGETRIFVGMDVHNARNVGRTGVVSLRLRSQPWTLEPVWKFDPEARISYVSDPALVGPGSQLVADPLTHGSGTGDGCGGVWSSPVVDAERGFVAFGTASCPRDGITTGETMFAVNLYRGTELWSFNPALEDGARTRDDDDFGASPNLMRNGLVGEGRKDGTYYALDPVSGEKAWESRAGQPGHVSGDFSVGGMIGTAALGTVGTTPAIFATTALSTPVDEPLDGPPGENTLDRSLAEDPARMFSLHAISEADGSILWRAPLSRQSYGAPVFAGGVVLVPSTFDLMLKAFHAETGALLWEAPVGASSSTPVAVGDAVFFGTGTRTTDAEYKQFGGDPLEPVVGAHVLSRASGVWAFRLAAS